jgi:hypothetical protein
VQAGFAERSIRRHPRRIAALDSPAIPIDRLGRALIGLNRIWPQQRARNTCDEHNDFE